MADVIACGVFADHELRRDFLVGSAIGDEREDFSLAFVKSILNRLGVVRILHENPLVDVYSWELVCVKEPGGAEREGDV